MKTCTSAAALLALAWALPALAEDRVATKPGIMCSSASALAALTVFGGDSRTHVAHPRAADLRLARRGGCIDIPPGARVSVQQSFRNTAIATYGPTGSVPMVIPSIDFEAVPDAGGPAAAVPAGVAVAAGVAALPSGSGVAAMPFGSGIAAMPFGYRLQQQLASGDAGSDVLEVLEDERITPDIRAGMWHSSDVPATPDGSDILPAFKARPALDARVRLVSAAGSVVSEATLDEPLAALRPAGLHGLPHPAFILEIDHSAGTGSSGPYFELLSPEQGGVRPVTYKADAGGRTNPIVLGSMLRDDWRILPPRAGGTEEIVAAFCTYDSGDGRPSAEYRTFRFRDGGWHMASRTARECDDYEVFPPRRKFP